ncbi:zinc-binding dehydrogenase [Devosia sp. FKR38]|uniref:zinc-binding dehydrogenase n=1 Tax=Devosia sp. FKR38 TaxID=2562312 RepID=UPI0010C145D6|nr:zinc-binding dehydrogenase [Devosia sp. FKR38]
MKAAVLRQFGADLSIEDVPLANARDREVLVRIMATGVCSSDLSTIRGKTGSELPLIPGHEAAGIVERVGAGVSRVKPGDRVVLSWAPNCGHCFYCHQSHPTLCDTYGAAAGAGALWDGTSRLGGAQPIHHYSCISSFAEQAVVPETACIPITEDVPFAVAALVGCAVTTGFGAVINDAAIKAGQSIAVLGVGGVGVNAIQAAALAGAETIIAIDINADKAAVATTYGATHFINAAAPDLIEQVQALTHGRGVDHAVECTGRPVAMSSAYAITRSAGSVVIVGIAPVGAQFAIPAIGFPGSRKRIVGSIYGGSVPEQDINTILSLYRRGRLPLDAQIGRRIPLEQVNDALAWLEAGVMARTIIEFAA